MPEFLTNPHSIRLLVQWQDAAWPVAVSCKRPAQMTPRYFRFRRAARARILTSAFKCSSQPFTS